MVNIKPTELIEFGKEINVAAFENTIQYIFRCMDDHGTIKLGGTHHMVVMLADLQTAWGHLIAKTVEAQCASGTQNPTQVIYNLGRLAKTKCIGDDLVYSIERFEIELNKTTGGTYSTPNAVVHPYINMYALLGGDFTPIWGTWDNQVYRIEEDLIAGIWLTIMYILRFWNLHVRSIIKTVRKTGTLNAAHDQGETLDFKSYDSKTWGTLTMQKENGSIAVLGMHPDFINADAYKQMKVAMLDDSEILDTHFLSDTRWSVRFGRFIEVHPLYFIWCPDVGNNYSTISQWHNLTDHETVLLFTEETDTAWKWFNRSINVFCDQLKEFRFRNKAYSALKDKIKFVRFFDIAAPESGPGGLIAHQMTYIKHNVAADDMNHKFILDEGTVDNCMFLTVRANTENRYVFQAIGDITIPDICLEMAMMASHTKLIGAAAVAIPSRMFQANCRGGFMISLGKDEDMPYYAYRAISELEGYMEDVTKVDSPFLGADEQECLNWEDYADYPVALLNTKTAYYNMRATDPYKKLPHVMFHINNFNVDAVVSSFRTALWNVGAQVETNVIDKAVIATDDKPKTADLMVSAMPVDLKEKIEAKKLDTKEEKEQPVSAIPKKV